jgi:transposase
MKGVSPIGKEAKMRKPRYRVTLEPAEWEQLEGMLKGGRIDARVLTRARILLKSDRSAQGPGWSAQRIAEALECSRVTVERLRKRFVEEGLEASLRPRPTTRVYERKLDGQAEAHLITLACSDPPEGRNRWTLRLLADQVVALGIVDEVSHETVRHTMKKTSLSLG